MKHFIVVLLKSGFVYAGYSLHGQQWLTIEDALSITSWGTGADFAMLVHPGECVRIKQLDTRVMVPFTSIDHLIEADPNAWKDWLN